MEPFDNRLCDLKLRPAINRLHGEAGKCWARARAEVKELGNQARFFPAFIECQIEALRKYLEEVDRVCREVRLIDGNEVSSEFIRLVLVQRFSAVIAARKGAIQHELELHRMRTGQHNPSAQHHFIQKLNQLQGELATHYEIEAVELGKRAARSQVAHSRFTELHDIEQVDSELVRLGLADYTLSRLLRQSPEYLRAQYEQAKENHRRLRQVVPEGQLDLDVEKARMVEKQSAKALALRGEPSASSETTPKADLWRDFHDKFTELANEELQIERAAPKDRLLHAYCDYKEHPEVWEKGKPEQGLFCLLKSPGTGLWTISDGVSEHFQARFRALALRAGIALATPKGTDAEDFWLHRLYLDLLENRSDQLFAASKEGGVIRRVCVASATFSSRLERKALKALEPARDNARRSTDIGRNIDKLRKECGWSFDQLADETGIDKKLILSHVNKGARPVPRILKEYAQTFSKGLQRKITVSDLES